MKIRCVYNDGTSLEFSQTDAKNYLSLDRSKLESVALLSDNGDELYTLNVPSGFTFAYRTRSLIGVTSKDVRERFIIFGLVNAQKQVLHFLNDDGKLVEVVDTPEEFQKYGEISLRQEEAI